MLQITEPDNKQEAECIVGIDLGTTHSLIACAKNGEVTFFTDEEGSKILPSVVLYEENQPPIVGKAALRENRAEEEQDNDFHSAKDRNTVSSIKRFMGHSTKEIINYARHEAYRLLDKEHVVLRLGGQELTPIEISADILKALKKRAEDVLKKPVHNAVITIPAYFNDAQRNATKAAAALAGLNVLRLLSEPTAAALAYGLDNQKEGTYLVYDMGGGTFDVSLLKLQDGIFQVIATGGDTWLGGDNIDETIAHFLEEHGGSWPARLQAARKLKETLSKQPSARAIADNTVYMLSKEQLEKFVEPVISQTIKTVTDVLTEGNADKVDGIIMVGGSTRMPIIREKLAEAFQAPLLTDLNPDEVVARGAALQAAALSGDGDSLLLDITPLSLGIETAGGLVEKIIPRNTTIPATYAQEFTTFMENQTAMDIHVLQGERETVEGCRSLGKFRLTEIPPMPVGQARIKVTFTLDADGVLTVTAQEQTTGHTQQVEMHPTDNLPEDKILEMLKSSFEHAKEDVAQRSIKEAQNELSNLIDACEKALKIDADLLSEEEASSLYSAVEQAKKELNNTNLEEVQDIAGSLDQAFSPFAEKRMNHTLQNTVVGLPASKFE